MRIESMVAQQAVLSHSTRRADQTGASRVPARPVSTHPGSSSLPTAVADRLAGFLAADPGLAEAISAHLPAARQACARDLAAYGHAAQPRVVSRFVDISG
jgi:hypothetical protein